MEITEEFIIDYVSKKAQEYVSTKYPEATREMQIKILSAYMVGFNDSFVFLKELGVVGKLTT